MMDLRVRPGDEVVGWCHSCETWQRGRDARWLEMRWSPGLWTWACVNCDDEPWAFGVWSCWCVRCEPEEEADPDAKCWEVARGRCADAQCETIGVGERCEAGHVGAR